MNNLRVIARNAIIWTALDKVSTQIVSIVTGIILARILNSSDYGIIGMLAIFTAIAGTCTDSGFSAALVRKKEPTHKDYSTIFYFNTVISILLYFFLYFCAPSIARFFNQPILIPLSRTIFATLIINSLGLVQTARLVKNIELGKIALINFLSLLISGITALYFAFKGYGVWSLTAQILSQSIAKTSLLWIAGHWYPKLIFSMNSFKELFSFGSNLMLANIINAIFQNIYSAFIGRVYDKNILGYYTQANKWAETGITTLYGTVQNATYTVFSSIQEEKERLIRAYRKTMKLTAFITFPVLACLALVSHPFISVLLSSKWEPSTLFLQILSVAGIFTVFTTINGNFIKISGESKWILKLEITKIILVTIALSCTWKMSITYVVTGLAVVKAIIYILYVVSTDKCTGYKWYRQLQDIFPYLGLTALMIFTAYPLKLVIKNTVVLLFLQITVCVIFYYWINKKLNSAILKEIKSSFSINRKE
ncbi:lipopolysaccharide biosynthesis protein [Coprobacter tertius]|uniref:Lipopolysaccharide biosynthesis protein n=1 Tax=Coprobacter tertius TaxID=2944915 RepID=A0ABT1MDB2_9BACT|nr:lipopolysaccharide biosynthesis protein [Coprobacter tertius]MCP9610605.1 lipopolysaccharide biosynthesis protein [Coprobacter tertius]